ncbi:hypothetical protein FS837_002906 [Tulasnella sp. UAMH 9824]|nr:hypothetical protein FS837_002906 [Tulasnella sp. UAMH 9824]
MANVEDTSNSNIIFRGTDGNECEAFVAAIRDLAFANGKDGDHSWMLRYATTRLRATRESIAANRAPTTASTPLSAVDVNEVVPPTITQPSDTLPPGNELVPPPRFYDPSFPGHYMGRLRVVYEDSRAGPNWIRANLGSRHVTSDTHGALIVAFISSSECHHIGCLVSTAFGT